MFSLEYGASLMKCYYTIVLEFTLFQSKLKSAIQEYDDYLSIELETVILFSLFIYK